MRIILLCGVLMGCAADEALELASTTDELTILPPSNALVRPDRISILPVLYIPADSGIVIPGMLDQGKENLRIELRTTQLKYREMLARPGGMGQKIYRGTFQIATWDAGLQKGKVFDPTSSDPTINTLEPLVINSTRSMGTYDYGDDLAMMEEIYKKTRCKAQSCPFIFVVAVASVADNQKFYGRPMAYGHNSGGGFVRAPAMNFVNATSWKLQSTLQHELGHTMGLMHTSVYSVPGVDHLPPTGCFQDDGDGIPEPDEDLGPCTTAQYQAQCSMMDPLALRYAFHCSRSIMSYGFGNATTCLDAVAPFGECELPTAAQVALMPGTMIAENEYNFARAELVFPDFAKDFDLVMDDDDLDAKVLEHASYEFPERPGDQVNGHVLFKMTSPHSEAGAMPRVVAGNYSNAIRPFSASYDDVHMWRSVEPPITFPPQPIELYAHFPEAVMLNRIRVFSGHSDGEDVPDKVTVRKPDGAGGWNWCGSSWFSRADVDLMLGTTGSCGNPATIYRIEFGDSFAISTPRVVLRGIRFFDSANEYFSPREPVATSADGHLTLVSPIKNIVGSEQQISSYGTFWNPATMWHSKNVGANNEVTIDIRLPHPVQLSMLAIYTGHNGTYNPADHVVVQRRDSSGNYVTVANLDISANALLGIATEPTLTHLRIKLRAPSGFVTVRGLRLFQPGGEIFAPRSEADGLFPLE